MQTGFSTVTSEVLADPGPILPEWESLAERVGTVFSSRPSFVRNVAHADQLVCEYVIVRRDGRLVALAALSKVRRGLLTVAKIVGTNLGVPLEFLSEDDAASDALLAAMADRGYVLAMDSLISGERTVERLRIHPSWTVEVEVRERVPVIEVPPGEGASSVRGAKSLKRLRQYRRELRRESTFEIEVIADAPALEARWPDLLRVAADAIEGTDKANYLVSPHGEFARDFLLDEARSGRLCIAGLVVDGEWSAHEIGLRTKHRMEGWLTHYDAAISRVQPGHQLIEWFVDHHDDLGVTHLDQGVGVNKIKSAWAKSGYDVLRVAAVPRSWPKPNLLARALFRYPVAVAAVRERACRVTAASRRCFRGVSTR